MTEPIKLTECIVYDENNNPHKITIVGDIEKALAWTGYTLSPKNELQ